MLRLHDTALGSVRELEPRDPGQLSIYLCGPTVYDDPHIGHGRFALVWDVIRRYLTWSGLDVRFVSNVTDIDDKIINRANAEGRDPADVAKEYEAVWFDVMDRLNIGRPTDTPHATEYVERMVAFIAELVERGRAYQGGDGVYFAVGTVEDYGLLANQPIESLKVGARVEVDREQHKRSPLDFALWKSAKPGEPWWPSPWGDGRPGWHTECVVMALDLLDDDFDLHGGGIDLAFPHHENERAQAVAAGRCFAQRWTHSGHVVAEGGEKMSKSLGNTMSLPTLLRRYDPRAYRLLVLQSHYRSPMTVSDVTMAAADKALERLDALARRFPDTGSGPAAEPDPAAMARFRERMDDDLDTVRATADLFDLATRANTLADRDEQTDAAPLVAAVRQIGAAVGLVIGSDTEAVGSDAAGLAAAGLAADRDRARAERNYARADEIRRQLEDAGWAVEDTPE
ncbi:MAG: cysteine--tRNA ligase, partial [Actinomycetota bacterium]|nr:cysteine--tRNA ligase [Actinomycetota bacterium]